MAKADMRMYRPTTDEVAFFYPLSLDAFEWMRDYMSSPVVSFRDINQVLTTIVDDVGYTVVNEHDELVVPACLECGHPPNEHWEQEPLEGE